MPVVSGGPLVVLCSLGRETSHELGQKTRDYAPASQAVTPGFDHSAIWEWAMAEKCFPLVHTGKRWTLPRAMRAMESL